MKSDSYITPEKKARWGFGGSKSKVTIGSKPKDEGETKAKSTAKPKDEGKK